jgi:hypothetical protein
MSILGLVKNGRVSVFFTMYSNHSMCFILTKFEQQDKKKAMKKKKQTNKLGP